jgi:16S rRNA (adenine1518-N6/adenine1519-N6)-dimethyltransferase
MSRSTHVPRRRFGQHFLADEAVIEAIVEAIDPRPGEALVEIGPGLGALTAPLLARAGSLTVIELDRDLAQRLRSGPGRTGLTVVESDVLQVDFAALAARAGAALRVVGNLPYNISTPILFHLLEAAPAVRDQHFMLQQEVVERMAAAPGGRDYGRLSVMLQWRYRIEPLFEVGPEAFTPPPRVRSAVVRMVPLPLAEVGGIDARRLGELVTIAFSQRRKVLRHTLARWLDAHGYAGEFDARRRAEEVPVAEYVALANAVGRAPA